MPRGFRDRRRLALYLAAGGYCALCGSELTRDWEADHIVPFARGGATTLENGAALCRTCNRAKGARVIQAVDTRPSQGHIIRPPREWQIDQLERWREWSDTDFLNVATMGAGKTGGACMILKDALDRKRIDFVVVVVPTNHLRRQWARAAAVYGLNLNPNWRNSDTVAAPDEHGVVITYAQLAATPGAVEYWKRSRRTIGVVTDEIHHCGEQLAWGEAIRGAFEHAAFRLHLSGTPFRCDRTNLIPFVPTQNLGNGEFRAVPSYAYTYAQALVGKVCRDVYFPSYDGEMRWAGNADQIMTASFADPLPREEQSRRLRTALDPKPDSWLATVLREANAELSSMRQAGHSKAGGLVVAIDIEHAKKICVLLERISGESPVLATSDDPIASELIEEFNKGSQRWLVAVRMVSEGVDILRLRVGVYASNIVAPLFVFQVIGRVVRYDATLDDTQYAAMYMPDEARLVAVVRQFQQERDLAFKVRLNDLVPSTGGGSTPSLFTPLGSQAEASTMYARSGEYSAAEVLYARQIQAQTGLTRLATADVANIVRAITPTTPAVPGNGQEDPLEQRVEQVQFERKADLKTAINKSVRHLVMRTVLPTFNLDKEEAFKRVGHWLADTMGAWPREATVSQLEYGLQAVHTALKDGLPRQLATMLED